MTCLRQVAAILTVLALLGALGGVVSAAGAPGRPCQAPPGHARVEQIFVEGLCGSGVSPQQIFVE